MSPVSTRQKVGLVLAGLLSAANVPSVFFPTPDGQEGPPIAVLAISAVVGVIGLVAVVLAWRDGNRAAVRIAAGTLVVNVLTSLPAFFVDVSAGIKLLTGVGVLVTIAAIVLMLSPTARLAQDRQVLS
jgi:uncharacterized membrane protein YfcA